MSKDKYLLVDVSKLDSAVYVEFYPRISHKQRKRLLDCVSRSKAGFEEKELIGLSLKEFKELSDEQKFFAYENAMVLYANIDEEMESLRNEIAEEREEISRNAW